MTDPAPANLRFSISTPVGAYHPLLRNCLESLRRQSAPIDLAFLDASGDSRVAQLADAYRDIIRYRRHGPDGGQSAAIREGWAQSDAPILGWLNADDLLYPEALTVVAQVFEAHPEVDVVYGHSAICDDAMRMTGYHWAVSPPGPGLRLGCNISQPSCFFRRGLYDAVGGLDGDLHYTMDWDLWLRFEDHGARLQFLEQPLSAVYWGQGTKTAGFNAARRAELKRLIDRYTPPSSRLRVFRGFAIQATLDRLQPPRVARFARQTLARNRSRIFGIGPDGRLDAHARVTWFHLEHTPRDVLELTISGSGPLDIRSARSIAEARATATGYRVRFAEPVAAGEVVSIDIGHRSRGWRRLRACEWQRS